MSSYLSEQAARFCFPHWLEFNEQLCTDISHQCPYFTREFKSRQIKNKCNISVSGPVSEIARPDWSLNYKPFRGFFNNKRKIKRRCGDVIVKKFRNAAIYLTAESETLMLPQTVQSSSTNTYKKMKEMNNYLLLLSNHQTPWVRVWSEGRVTSAPRKQRASLSPADIVTLMLTAMLWGCVFVGVHIFTCCVRVCCWSVPGICSAVMHDK